MNIIGLRKWTLAISGLLVLAAIASLIAFQLRPGIDFSGGAAFNIEFSETVEPDAVRAALVQLGQDEAIIQPSIEEDGTFGRTYFIRVGELEPAVRDDEGNIVEPGGREDIEAALTALVEPDGTMEVTGFDNVSGIIASDNIQNAIIAVIFATIVILFYVSWAFRRVPSPFRYGTAAVIALIHDVVIVLGVFSILGETVEMEINAMFITGVLTIIGYSVNDTIVVFDRVRENTLRFPASSVAEVVNLSVRETIGRSLNTSVTLLIVVAALLLFAATSIQPLLYVMAAGVVVGTYSSIFVASLLLVAWEHGEIGGFFSHIPLIGRRRTA